MIGGPALRRAIVVLAVAFSVVGAFGLRSSDASLADPPLANERHQAFVAAAASADSALAALGIVVGDAVEHARKGAALTLAGDDPPAPELNAAADALVDGAALADAATQAVARLAGMAASIAPDARSLRLPFGGPDLLKVAALLRSSADAATLFVERRRATTQVVTQLTAAAAALERDDPTGALAALDAAQAPRDLLLAWTDQPSLFRYWMRVSGDLLDAARGIAEATLSGDAEAVAAAGEAYRRAGETARGADNGLAVTLAEEAAAVTDGALRQLAALAAGAADTRDAVEMLMRSGG